MAASETCSSCGQEVRWGWRDGREAYWHRDPADHQPVFGYVMTDEDWAEIERQLDLPRERNIKVDPEGFPLLFEVETYTAREHDEARYLKDKKYRAAKELEEPTDDEEEGHDAEPVEVYSTPMPHKGSLSVPTAYGERQVPVPGGVRTIINLSEKVGWEVERLTYARGPYLGAAGKSLGVSDSVVLRVRGPVVDERPLWGIASWRDGKSDWAWRVEHHGGRRVISSVGARALIAWMKENPCV